MCTIVKEGPFLSDGKMEVYSLRGYDIKRRRSRSICQYTEWSIRKNKITKDSSIFIEPNVRDKRKPQYYRGMFHVSESFEDLLYDSPGWHELLQQNDLGFICSIHKYIIPKGEKYYKGINFRCSDYLNDKPAILTRSLQFKEVIESILITPSEAVKWTHL